MPSSRRGVSLVISALIVTGIFLTLVSSLLAVQNSLHQAEIDALKRETMKAMEAPFQIFWLNDTHVRLFNNHSSVDITLKYWITSGLSVSVIALNPPDYSVGPGTYKDVKAGDPPKTSGRTYKVVSERGMVFVVGEAEPGAEPPFTITDEIRQVRPGFNALLTRVILATNEVFGGGQVALTCVPGTPDLCSLWGITFVPSSPVNVPTGGAVTVNINANIPSTQSTGSYYLRLRAAAGGFSKEFVVNVLVGDFTVTVGQTITLSRAGCLVSTTVNVGTLLYLGEISLSPTNVPSQLAVWISPNPLDLSHGQFSTSVYVYRLFIAPTGNAFTTNTITLQADDGLGATRIALLVVVHRGTQTGNTC
ncbi:MAG: hypothetical protein QW756_06040 [Nitrososphaerota archaeon]